MIKGQKMGQWLTHCKYGHEFTEDNIIWRRRNRGRGEELSRICRICHNERGKKYSKSLPPERRLEINTRLKEWRKNNKEYVRHMRLRQGYGITLADYNAILISQNNKCLICGKEPDHNVLTVDHDHETGQIRGILCSRCNRSLGWYEKCKNGIETYLKTVNERRINKSA